MQNELPHRFKFAARSKLQLICITGKHVCFVIVFDLRVRLESRRGHRLSSLRF
jgi:hypothetical protein